MVYNVYPEIGIPVQYLEEGIGRRRRVIGIILEIQESEDIT